MTMRHDGNGTSVDIGGGTCTGTGSAGAGGGGVLELLKSRCGHAADVSAHAVRSWHWWVLAVAVAVAQLGAGV